MQGLKIALTTLICMMGMTACAVSSVPRMAIDTSVSSSLLSAQKLPGWNVTLGSAGSQHCSSLFVRAKPFINDGRTVIHTVSTCNSESAAKEDYMESSNGRSPSFVKSESVITATVSLKKADEQMARCQLSKSRAHFSDGTFADTTCVVVARYGKVVSRMSILADSRFEISPSGTQLLEWTVELEDKLVALNN